MASSTLTRGGADVGVSELGGLATTIVTSGSAVKKRRDGVDRSCEGRVEARLCTRGGGCSSCDAETSDGGDGRVRGLGVAGRAPRSEGSTGGGGSAARRDAMTCKFGSAVSDNACMCTATGAGCVRAAGAGAGGEAYVGTGSTRREDEDEDEEEWDEAIDGSRRGTCTARRGCGVIDMLERGEMDDASSSETKETCLAGGRPGVCVSDVGRLLRSEERRGASCREERPVAEIGGEASSVSASRVSVTML